MTATAQPRSLKQRILRAGGWTLAGYGASQAIRLGSSLIMTRLLVPEMFGVMAIATMVMVILNMMSDLGLHQNIVQSSRGEDPAFLDTAWVLQILRGMVLWLLALLISAGLYVGNQFGLFPPASVYASPVLPAVIAVSAFSAVISGFQTTGTALAHRKFDQKRLVLMDLMGQSAALVFMIVAGFATRSIWALVGGGLVGTATIVLLSHYWLGGHRSRLQWDRAALRELIGFGKWTFVSSLFTVLAANGDRLLLGGYLDSDGLGLYSIAALLLIAIQTALARVFTAVSLPALSEIARTDAPRLREIYYRLRIPGDLVLLFSGGVLFAAGQLVVDALYDPRYAAAGAMLQVLALSMVAARYDVSYHIYLAVGKPRYLAIINVVRCIALFAIVPPVYIAWGTDAAIWGIALNGLAQIPFIVAFNSRLGLHDTRRELLVLVALPLGMACGYAVDFAVARLGLK
jgi:O-antigen/teichoic acid export membrane protein